MAPPPDPDRATGHILSGMASDGRSGSLVACAFTHHVDLSCCSGDRMADLVTSDPLDANGMLGESVSFSLMARWFRKKFLVQRDRIIVFFNDIAEAINHFENTCPLRAVQRLAQQS
jgi:hypothetical protein